MTEADTTPPGGRAEAERPLSSRVRPTPASGAPDPPAPPPSRPKRRRWPAVLALLALPLMADATGPPSEQILSRLLLGSIDLYQATLSPMMPAAGVRCRFQPTCSRYGEGAIAKYGAVPGTLRTAWRLLRCAPWTPQDTFDPP